MRKIELLAPAGSPEALKAAVQSGANAIYLGGTLFNARAFAANFSNEELEKAVEYAHLRNVKIYVTVNTLYYDDEFEELMDYIRYLYSIQIDALIIQDLGLMDLVHRFFPDFEIHASTQASIHQLKGVQALQKYNIQRVVLARENTLDEIRYICQNTPLEIEVFVHGALCMSYSGQCLMSSMIGGRSGNRGTCAQPCRLAYKLRCNQQNLDISPHYLLSAKDICVLENIGDFIDAGVTSFKIEGRMKRPEYVAAVVKGYRKAIDTWLEKHELPDLKQEKDDIMQMFNRGLSKGHAYNEKDLITDLFPGHLGTIIGKVIRYDKKQKRVYIKLSNTLLQGDGIRFGYEDNGRIVNKIYLKEHLVNKGNKDDMIAVEFNQQIKENTLVFKTSSAKLIERLEKEYQNSEINLPLSMKISGNIGTPLLLELDYQNICVKLKSEAVIEQALNNPLDHQRIIQQFSKLGNTVYKIDKIELNLPENMQFPIKAINELRRQGIEALNKKRTSPNHDLPKNIFLPDKQLSNKRKIKQIHVHVLNKQQALFALEQQIDVIYYPIDRQDIFDIYELCCKKQTTLIPFVSKINSDKQLEQIKHLPVYSKADTLLVGDLGAVEAFKEKKLILDTSLNITNSYALNHPLILNHDCILSVEMSENQINQLNNKNTDRKLGYVVYGRIETMTSRYCPISQQHFHSKKIGCNLCQKGQYYLIDRKNEAFPILMDKQCNMHLYNAKTLYIDELQHVSLDFIVLKMTTETAKEVSQIIQNYQNIIYHHQDKSLNKGSNITLGYFKNKKK